MRKRIKVYFTDFWPVFELNNNFFLSLLKKEYEVEVTKDNPDFLFYSVFGNQYQRYSCTRIFYTGENIRPDFNECDFAFSFDYIENNPRHYRLPLYPFFNDVYKLLNKPAPEEIIKEKTRFCNFIYSNPGQTKRNEFFRKLSLYKKVDSGGKYMNNIGGRVGNKLEFIKNYKFTIAFENESYPGYTTEKIFEPMLVNSLPIYWGNPLVGRDFNTGSFLSYHDFSSDEELIERIIEIDKNDDLYMQYLKEPYFENNRVNAYADHDNILSQLKYIISSDKEPIARTKPVFSDNPLVSASGRFLDISKYSYRKTARKLKYFTFNKLKMKVDTYLKNK